ncbi:MAG: hypothetical protein ABJE10_00435 [bacterium]
MSKTTIIVLSDPNGGEEALGRVFNALAAALDFKQQQRPAQVVFQGTGTRWPGVLAKPDHPAHGLYNAVVDTVAGASPACATVFGALADVEQAGLSLLATNAVPGTAGLPSLVGFLADGPVLIF